MAVALQVVSVDNTRRKKRITYKPTFSGNYTNPGGDTLDFTAATDPNFKNARIPAVAPEFIEINGNPGGNGAEGIPGTTAANGKIKLFSSVNTELAGGAYNAAVTGDVNVTITAVFPQAKS
jgi:hypothetical protein